MSISTHCSASRDEAQTVLHRAVATPILVNSGNAIDQKPLAEAASNNNALQRFGDPEELAEAVVWLSSGRASYVTATTLACNGGEIGG